MPSLNVSLTAELVDLIHSKVSGGMYSNASEVVRDALRRLDSNDELLYELKLLRVREALRPGIEQARNADFAEYNLDALIQELDAEQEAPENN